jgi:hypothetical protein
MMACAVPHPTNSRPGVNEHLLRHAGPPGLSLINGAVDVVGWRQFGQDREIGRQAQPFGRLPEAEPDQAAGPLAWITHERTGQCPHQVGPDLRG